MTGTVGSGVNNIREAQGDPSCSRSSLFALLRQNPNSAWGGALAGWMGGGSHSSPKWERILTMMVRSKITENSRRWERHTGQRRTSQPKTRRSS